MTTIIENIEKEDGWKVLSMDPLLIKYDINPQSDDKDQMKMLRDLKDGRRSTKQMGSFNCVYQLYTFDSII